MAIGAYGESGSEVHHLSLRECTAVHEGATHGVVGEPLSGAALDKDCPQRHFVVDPLRLVSLEMSEHQIAGDATPAVVIGQT